MYVERNCCHVPFRPVTRLSNFQTQLTRKKKKRRTEVAVEAGADVVPVETVHVLAPPENQLLLERLGDRALAAAAETGHPQGGALLPHRRVPLGAREVARLPEGGGDKKQPTNRGKTECMGLVSQRRGPC